MFVAQSDPIIMWVAVALMAAAAALLHYKIKIKNLPLLYPLVVYLGSIAFSFLLLGIYQLTKYSPLSLFSSFFIMFGAAYITRFPLRLITPKHEHIIFRVFFVLSIIIALYTFYNGDSYFQLRYAHIFAFVLAGLFTIGYIIYSGIKTKNRQAKIKSLSAGTTLGLCCVVSHGLLAFNIIPFISLPFLSITAVELPIVFATAAAITFILVLLMSSYLK